MTAPAACGEKSEASTCDANTPSGDCDLLMESEDARSYPQQSDIRAPHKAQVSIREVPMAEAAACDRMYELSTICGRTPSA